MSIHTSESDTATPAPARAEADIRPGAEGAAVKKKPLHRFVPPTISVATGLLAWQLLVAGGVVSDDFFPAPTSIADALLDRATSGALFDDIAATMQSVVVSTALAVCIAVPLGVLFGTLPLVYRAARFPIEFLRPLPSVALIPLVVLIFGAQTQSKVALATFGAVWPLLILVMQGVRDVDPVVKDAGRSYGLNAFQRSVSIVLPSSLPFAASGLRLAVTTTLLLTVTAEIVIGAPGLGQTLSAGRMNGNVELMYAMIFVTGVLGMLINVTTVRIEKRVLHWHTANRAVSES